MAPHKVLLMFAVLFGGGMALGWALQMALESGASPGVMQWLSVAGVVALLVVLWRVGASARRAIAAATPKGYGARTPRAIVLGCVLVVAAAWGTATLLNLLGASLQAIRWLVPAVCVPIVLWLMSRAVRTDADRFFRDDAPPQTWAEGGNTLLDEAILGFCPDDPFEPRRYDVADAHGNIVGSVDRAAGSPGETTFIARDARGTQFTISARKLNGRWSATVSDDGGRPVGSFVQALRPLHGLYVAGFLTAVAVLVALFAAPFVLSGDAVNEPAPAPLVYVGMAALVLTPVLAISLFARRYVPAFRFGCIDGTAGRLVPGPTEEVALYVEMVTDDGRALARASRVWEEGLPRRLFADAGMVVDVAAAASDDARMVALATPAIVGLIQPPASGAARTMGNRVRGAWKAGAASSRDRPG